MEIVNEIITTAIQLVCLIIIFLLSKYVIPVIKSNLSTDKLEEIKKWVMIFVQAVEQELGAGTGKEKKELVVDYITAKCEELKIDISNIDLDSIIESCVYTMNQTKR